ncbi:MAG: ADP-ribosylglycohydrolase family protein [Succiniclasticum sp.]|nr:ADP-ribosylglycohydrolase family protein [Succiniclasticum sp.]MEE3479254.1 ADP-ribosylglycohydrolase family protein [Succiniclasticum sp.]
MLGAIIGDVAGSRFEWDNHRDKEFDLFAFGCEPTDDSIMTLAVARALLETREDRSQLVPCVIRQMQHMGRRYPNAGYGARFEQWLDAKDPKPYNSYGNGAAMRVSACAQAAASLAEAKQLAADVTAVTHNHPEGMKGAEAVTVAIFLAREGKSKEAIRKAIEDGYYKLDFKLDEIRDSYQFDETCQGSVPQALEAFFEGTGFEDTIRNAISIGGDSDTIAAIAGSVAEAYYGVPDEVRQAVLPYLDTEMRRIVADFEAAYPLRKSR